MIVVEASEPSGEGAVNVNWNISGFIDDDIHIDGGGSGSHSICSFWSKIQNFRATLALGMTF